MVKKVENQKVVVTTAHRGVFFGELIENNAPKSVKLKGAKNCLYWGSSLHGFIGLASAGPDTTCRIGPSATMPMDLFDITSMIECTPEAVKRWKEGNWA